MRRGIRWTQLLMLIHLLSIPGLRRGWPFCTWPYNCKVVSPFLSYFYILLFDTAKPIDTCVRAFALFVDTA